MNQLHPVVAAVTQKITERSAETRADYLARTRSAAERGPARGEAQSRQRFLGLVHHHQIGPHACSS